MIEIGRAARYLRESLGLSQRKAAERLEITPVHLCNIEKGRSLPSPELLEAVRKLWQVDLYVLAWCLYGDHDQLPRPMRKATRSLTKAWRNHIQGSLFSEGRQKESDALHPPSKAPGKTAGHEPTSARSRRGERG